MALDIDIPTGIEIIRPNAASQMENSLSLLETALTSFGAQYTLLTNSEEKRENRSLTKRPQIFSVFSASDFGTKFLRFGASLKYGNAERSGTPTYSTTKVTLSNKRTEAGLALAAESPVGIRAGVNVQHIRAEDIDRNEQESGAQSRMTRKVTGLLVQIGAGYQSQSLRVNVGYRPYLRLYQSNNFLSENEQESNWGTPYGRQNELLLGVGVLIGKLRLMYAHERHYRHQTDDNLNDKFVNALGAEMEIGTIAQPFFAYSKQTPSVNRDNPRAIDVASGRLTLGTRIFLGDNLTMTGEVRDLSSEKEFQNENDGNNFFSHHARSALVTLQWEMGRIKMSK
jgi:hypothetical protein